MWAQTGLVWAQYRCYVGTMARQHVYRLRLSEGERGALIHLSAAAGLSAAEYIRSRLRLGMAKSERAVEARQLFETGAVALTTSGVDCGC